MKGALFVVMCFSFITKIFTTVEPNERHKCDTIRGQRTRRYDHEIFPRRVNVGSKHGRAIEFENGAAIVYPRFRNPLRQFSVDFWMKPEGGQSNPAIIIHAYDKCSAEHESRGWSIDLREAAVKSDLRVAFSLHVASTHSKTTIISHSKVEALRWYHIAATYDGSRMKLYVNQAKVAVGHGQKGMIFDTSSQGHECDLLEVGGDVRRGWYYRGQIDKLRVWNEAISHRKVTERLPESSVNSINQIITINDDFDDDKDPIRKRATKKLLHFVRSTVPDSENDLSIKKPPCGKTICDNPEVIKSYDRQAEGKTTKHLRMRFINVMDDHGKKAMLQTSKIASQFNLTREAFEIYNISWSMEIKEVRSTRLLNTFVLHNCELTDIGNKFCDPKCRHKSTAWDGGDCIPLECSRRTKIGDGVCHPECNGRKYRYDGGDCCTPTSNHNCADPTSEHRRYLTVNEYKRKIGITNKDALNVYVVHFIDENLQGVATMPWDKTIHTELGGVTLPLKNFGKTEVLIHEIGHVLGLWHIHYGSASEMACSDDCFETFPSLELGDLCSDTKPTVQHTSCSDPVVTKENSCGLSIYTNTSYTNYMSYADDSCTNHFTPQQVARMHCYIDLDFQSWQAEPKPSFISLPPWIVHAENNMVKLSWLPPLGAGGENAKNLCNECDDDKVLQQYAVTALSSLKSYREPHEAIGPPDAEQCSRSPLAWQVDEVTAYECMDCEIYLEVGFKQAVVPQLITIWTPCSSNDRETFKDIVLFHVDGTEKSIGGGIAQCDSPYTKPIYVEKKVASVRIYVSDMSVCIDAVKLTSGIGHPNCSKCLPLRYVVERNPPFDSEIVVPTAHFEDKTINPMVRYEYRVKAVSHENESGSFSPPLIYESKRGFCGDGKIDDGENCDDGNIRDGDGCNIKCQMEDVFMCDGRPSLCYRHDGDGVCEDFEKRTSFKDCGFFVPEGFEDQWARRAQGTLEYKHNCDIPGSPKSDLKCESPHDTYHHNVPCSKDWVQLTKSDSNEKSFLTVYFKTPAVASAVVVYIEGIQNYYLGDFPLINFHLYGDNPGEKISLEHPITKYCKENPIIVPIHHDMTKPFFKTHFMQMKFKDTLKIAGVALRSPKYFDPVELQFCKSSQLFNPSTQKCHEYDCKLPRCPKLMMKNVIQIKGKCKKGGVDGDKCTVECNEGFNPDTPFEIICLGGKWLVNGKTPKCMPVDCGLPKIENAQINCPSGQTFTKKCTYTCEKDSKPSGSATELSVTCEADGSWSPVTSFCRKTCLLKKPPLHSKLLPQAKTCTKGKRFMAGESCKYRCKPGYRPSTLYHNEKNAKGDFVQRCLKDGKWSRWRCEKITCNVPNRKLFRWYHCTHGNVDGSTCRLPCHEKVYVVKCGRDGRWNDTFQTCATKGFCPPLVKTGNVVPRKTCDETRPGDKCSVRCENGKTPVAGLSNDVIESMECSPLLRWHPNISEIRCTCNQDSLGDDICDGGNNNEDCNYDRGDCCGPHRDISSCEENCDCLDPMSPYFGRSSGDGRNDGSFSS